MYLFLIFPSFFLLRDKEAIRKRGKGNNEEGKKQNWTFTFIGTDDLDVENIALNMGIDNHLQFSEDEAGTKAMFARENRARERYNKYRAMDCKMEAGSYFEEK